MIRLLTALDQGSMVRKDSGEGALGWLSYLKEEGRLREK